MKKSILTAILLMCFTLNAVAQTKAEASKALIENLIKEKKVVGVSASYAVNGEIQWASASGFADKEKKSEFTINTEVRTASIAKSMTAIAVMQLVEQGLVDINLPIDTYIPEFVQKGKTKITTKHLLSHTSGIGAYKNLKEIENKVNYETLLDAYDVFKNRKLRFEPGTEFYYTSYGYVILGILIEKVSGLSFEAYMQKHIWDKANMTNTGIEKPQIKRQQTASLYSRDRKDRLKNIEANNLSNRIPAGGFYSTVSDLVKFGNALLDNTLVSEATIKLMTTHHSLEKVNNSYGFGFYLYGKRPNEGGIYGHNGAQTGTSTQLFIIPSRKTVVAVISNTSRAGREVSTVAGELCNIFNQKDE
ncbi:serine hydrolase domain-containing protein [Winogradskyella flava]|uniref:Beta-lactamase family protein n=1 Tax=Winogradskyella flava TaxID=1884876 RepID=A0A842IVL5_9FLAO|nr:serine hydrolase domain-containing protein [Winogradskyella flava]MBC2845984.1 beta-lactamase family protein [Winogradskyella flava]